MRKQSLCSSIVLSIGLICGNNAAYADDKPNWSGDLFDADNWEVALGFGGMYKPKFEGSKDNEFDAIPLIDIEWNNLIYLNPQDGLGIHAYQGESLSIDAGIGYAFGREETDSRKELNGLGDIDSTATFNLSFSYDLDFAEAFIDFSKHLGSSNGLEIEFGAEKMIPLFSGSNHQQGPMLSFGLSATWANDNYMDEFFDVTALQSSRSGLAQYDAGSGIKSVNAEVGFIYPISKHWSTYTSVEYSKLTQDAADSPITRDDSQVEANFLIRYDF